ncbi:MAG: sugar ABC transporter permease [Lachnospiraceae bacterium]|jgi:multiple sugar transport system permease protein|nr:sugar ABC transporter permease [Lachnospiraceae bacterium]
MRKHLTNHNELIGHIFLLPWILGLFGLTLFPMIASLYLSFTHYDLLTPARWAGLGNYIQLFGDPKFLKSLGVTFRFVLISVPFQLAFALLVAVVLKRNRRGVRIYRAIYYLPSLFGGSVAVAILWRRIFGKDGLVNLVLGWFGIKGVSWITTPSTALTTLIILAIWQFGSSMVIFLASLKQIPQDYYEAASIDGAGKVRQFFSITLPLLTPMVFFNVVMTIISSFQSFTPSYIVSGGTGGPLDATLLYSLYIYIKGFTQFQMGYASAMAWMLLFIIGAFTGLIFLSAKRWVFYE